MHSYSPKISYLVFELVNGLNNLNMKRLFKTTTTNTKVNYIIYACIKLIGQLIFCIHLTALLFILFLFYLSLYDGNYVSRGWMSFVFIATNYFTHKMSIFISQNYQFNDKSCVQNIKLNCIPIN